MDLLLSCSCMRVLYITDTWADFFLILHTLDISNNLVVSPSTVHSSLLSLVIYILLTFLPLFWFSRHRHLRGGRSSHQARMCENEAPTAAHREQDLQDDARRRYVFPHSVDSSSWSPSGFSINTELWVTRTHCCHIHKSLYNIYCM